jgi:tetratricopeptide (TPR) repeat protein
MVQPIEIRISELFSEHRDALKVADILLKEWNEGRLAWVEQEAVGLFLVRSGFTLAFWDQILNLTQTNQKIPWCALAEALGSGKTELTKEDIDQIFVGASEENSLSELVKSWKLDRFDARLAKVRQNIETSQVFNSPSKESKATHETQTAAPVQKRILPPEVETPLVNKIRSRLQSQFSAELRNEFFEIFEQALQLCPNQSREAAVALAMMDLWDEALKILRSQPMGLQEKLLEVRFVNECGRGIEALEFCALLFDSDEVSSTEKNYLLFQQAIALKSLKRVEEAAGCLEKVVEFDPDHFLARALLADIERGAT